MTHTKHSPENPEQFKVVYGWVETCGEKTKKAAINKALREFAARRERAKLRELFGQLEWSADFDYKREWTRG